MKKQYKFYMTHEIKIISLPNFLALSLLLNLLICGKNYAQWGATNSSGNINTVFSNGNDFLAGINGGDGAYVSTDNGLNWHSANTGMTQYPDVRAFGSNASYVFAGTTGGVYRSINDGSYSWTKVLDNASCFSLLTDGSNIYAGTMGGGVFLSNNDGATWNQVNNGLTMLYVYSLAYDGANIYAGTYHDGQSNGEGVFRSSDNGQNWTQVSNGLTNLNIMAIAVDANFIFAGTDGGGIFRSGDNGNTWTNVAGGVAHTLKVVCNTDLYAGFLSNGGISRSTDFGTTWNSYSNGLPNTGGYTVMSLAANSSYIIAGTLGGGVARAQIDCASICSICGMKFNDLNGNRVRDDGEPGLKEWTINLIYNSGAGPVTISTKTDSSGNYCFNNLTPGTYIVSETNQPGWTQTAPIPYVDTISLLSGQNLTDVNFGNIQDAVGCVQPPSGMVGWWPLDEVVGAAVVKDIIGINNGAPQPGPVGVMGSASDGPIPGSTLSFLNPKYKVDGSLYFYAGVNTKYVKVPDNSSLNFGTGDFTIDAWVYPVLGSNYVQPIVDKSQTTVAGCVGYRLFILNGQLNFDVMDGHNIAIVTAPITYSTWQHIAAIRKGGTPNTMQLFINGFLVSTITAQVNNTSNTIDFLIGGINSPNGGTLCGLPSQFNMGEIAIDELEIFNRVLTPDEIFSIWHADTFGKCKPSTQLGSICGIKFNDLNGNGTKDAGEPGLPNWKITLTSDSSISTLTDKNGDYCFTNLPSGNYIVAEVNQSGWMQTAPPSGTYSITLTAGQNTDGIDFGNTADPCLNGVRSWWPLGSGPTNGTNGEVWALAVIGSDLYVGGNFTTAGGITANHIAKWNGSSWLPLISSNGSNGINGNVTALAVNGTDLYAGGWFTTAGGLPALNIAKWDGTNWIPLGNGLSAAGAINALAVMDNDLYATSFISDASLGGPGNLIVKWDGSSWAGFSVMDDYVSTLFADGSTLYAGGQFTLAGNVPANHIAKWDGTNWSALGAGTNYWIGGEGIIKLNGDLIVGGRFTTAGNNSANFIAKWDGSNWSPFISSGNNGMNNQVECVAAMGNDLYASGSFNYAGGINANSIAKWDGANWVPLGSGMNDGVWRLVSIGGDLYAGGIFTTAGGGSANYIAKFSCNNSTDVKNGNTNNGLPAKFMLDQNYPNPFNPTTTIHFAVPSIVNKNSANTGSSLQLVTIKVYDLLGREVTTLVNEFKSPGNYEVQFDARNLTSGIYFCKMAAGEFTQSRKMILMK